MPLITLYVCLSVICKRLSLFFRVFLKFAAGRVSNRKFKLSVLKEHFFFPGLFFFSTVRRVPIPVSIWASQKYQINNWKKKIV